MPPTPTVLSLVGRTITVLSYQGKDLTPTLTGTIEEDTRNTLAVSTSDGNRTFLKDSLRCSIGGINDEEELDGRDLLGKIHERIKQNKHR